MSLISKATHVGAFTHLYFCTKNKWTFALIIKAPNLTYSSFLVNK